MAILEIENSTIFTSLLGVVTLIIVAGLGFRLGKKSLRDEILLKKKN
jgi:hypothetical protein